MANNFAIEGVPMRPFVKFGHTAMPTRHKGVTKQRPVFEVVGWHGGNGAALEHTTLQIEAPAKSETVEPKSIGDELNDSIDF